MYIVGYSRGFEANIKPLLAEELRDVFVANHVWSALEKGWQP